ncbi:hypothetical protein [Citrobacter portucalensis]|uniref:hypothetical protein n=1 Tax=Citrobacter portucalensis TaxID=1639133 RepID=UPI0039FC7A93
MGYADDTMAEITREAWEDWQTRYEPILDEMLSLEDTHQLMTDQLNRVSTNEQNSLNTAQVTQSNDMGRYGLASASNPQDQSDSVSAALSDASTKNGIRTAEQQRDLNILTGSGSKASSAMKYHVEGAY